MAYWMASCTVCLYNATLRVSIRFCRSSCVRQGLAVAWMAVYVCVVSLVIV